jgi:hypothetical protein
MVNFKKLNLVVLLGTAMIGAQVSCAYGMDDDAGDQGSGRVPPRASGLTSVTTQNVSDNLSNSTGGATPLYGTRLIEGTGENDNGSNMLIAIPGLIEGAGELLTPGSLLIKPGSMGPDAPGTPPASIPIFAFGLIEPGNQQTTSLNQKLAPTYY